MIVGFIHFWFDDLLRDVSHASPEESKCHLRGFKELLKLLPTVVSPQPAVEGKSDIFGRPVCAFKPRLEIFKAARAHDVDPTADDDEACADLEEREQVLHTDVELHARRVYVRHDGYGNCSFRVF